MISAVSILKYDQQPKLFSIVFGEGISNNAISIILFNTVIKSLDNGVSILSEIQIAGQFLLLCIGSIGIGIAFGLIASYCLK